MADFVTAIYNPKSHERYWQLYRLKMADMFTVVIIGNSQTYISGDKMITPRGGGTLLLIKYRLSEANRR